MEALIYAEDLLSRMPKGNARIYVRNMIEISDPYAKGFWIDVYSLLDLAIPKP